MRTEAGQDRSTDFFLHSSDDSRLDGGGVPISSKQDKFQLSDYEVSVC